MKTTIAFLISESILFPLIVGLIRFKWISKIYWPFVFQLIAASITEIVSFILIQKFHSSNAIPANIYVLVEWLLVAWLFSGWGFSKRNRKIFYALFISAILVWIVEDIIFGQITSFGPYYRFYYSFVIVILSVSKINFMIMYENRSLFRNPQFLIAIGFIIYFMYKIMYEWAYQISIQGANSATSNNIISLFAYINAFSNIIFGIAMLMIPSNKKIGLELK